MSERADGAGSPALEMIDRSGDLAPGTVIGGKYEILGVSGRGGMSTIYRARDTKVGRVCAVKQITDKDRGQFEAHRRSLLVEREMLAKLNHPRIPRITDIAEGEDGDFWVVMDFVEGETLQHFLEREGAQPQERVVKWAGLLGGVLGYLHEPERGRGAVIFRDVKPGNIMLTGSGDLVLFDFGIAAETEDGRFENEDLACTPGYAAPEQLRPGALLDRRTDIYGLGATVFALLTGKCPGSPADAEHIADLVPGIAPGLEEIVGTCMAEDPEERYQSCGELGKALEHWTERERDLRRRARRKLTLVAVCAAGAVFAFAAAGASFFAFQREKRQNYGVLISAADAAANDAYDVRRAAYVYDPQVVNLFLAAIDADPGSRDAYMKLLDYCAAAGMPEVGLMRVTANIDAEVGGIDRDDELLFKVARMYFDGVKVPGDGYREAAKYFSMISTARMPAAAYYRDIASILGQYNVLTEEDWRAVAQNLISFENYLDARSRLAERVSGYRLAASVYRTCAAGFEEIGTDAIAEAARLCGKALADVDDLLENADLLGTAASDTREAEDERRQILENLAVLRLLDTPNRDLAESEACYMRLLEETEDPEAVRNYRMRLAVVYREMGDDARVREWYAFLMREYPEDPVPPLEFASYLYNIGKDPEGAASYLRRAEALPGAEAVQNYRVLKNTLKNAGVL